MYSTVPSPVVTGLVSVCAMVLPLPAVAPVMAPVMVPIVQLNVLVAVADNAIFVVPPLQIAAVEGVETTGDGFTVTVIVYGAPAQVVEAVEVGVTIYCTVPGEALLGLTSVCAMAFPLPEDAPVMPPVIEPIVQVNVLDVLAFREIFVLVLLQMLALFAVVTVGMGFTVTVIVYGAPPQVVDAVDVGVTMYCTVPADALPGLIKVCAIVDPDPEPAPVMPPVIVPTVHANVLAAEEVKAIFVVVLLQIAAVLEVVTAGVGFTVTVMVYGAPIQLVLAVEVGVTIY